MKPIRLFPALAAASLLALLGACQPNAGGVAAAPHAARAAPGQGTSPAAGTAKYNAYIEAHTTLSGGAGLAAARSSYESAMLEARNKSANVSFSPGWIDHAIDQLRQARALPGPGLEEVDRTSERLVAALVPLLQALQDVSAYYTARTYIDDKFAGAKARYAPTLASFNAADQAAAAFYAALDQAATAREAREIETLRAGGDALAYELTLAMSQAKTLARLVNEAAAQAQAAARPSARPQLDFSRTDTAMQALEKTLAEARAELQRRKADTAAGADRRLTNEGYTLDSLGSLIGYYRSFKSTNEQRDGEQIFSSYNSAVGYYNGIRAQHASSR